MTPVPQPMPETRKTLIAVATYNEIETLPRLVDEIFRAVPSATLLVIDDDSPDGTGAWCEGQLAADPRIQCLHRAGKLGLGTALVAGMKHAIEHGYEWLVNLDADFSHDPASIPKLLAAMAPPDGPPADVAIGSRYVAGGRIEGWPLRRHLMSRTVNRYSRLLLRLPVRDCSGSFRCYRVSRLAELDLAQVVSRGYSFFEEILWRLARQGCRMVEVPITFVERKHGRSKINLGEALSALGTIAKLGLRWPFRGGTP
jgi:dolichol-phosphate mannosyltransferase